jgi:hypothetical protein
MPSVTQFDSQSDAPSAPRIKARALLVYAPMLSVGAAFTTIGILVLLTAAAASRLLVAGTVAAAVLTGVSLFLLLSLAERDLKLALLSLCVGLAGAGALGVAMVDAVTAAATR